MNLRSLIKVFIVLIAFLCNTAYAQQSITINWMDNDLTPYHTYKLESFIVNKKAVDYRSSERQKMLVNELGHFLKHKQMSHHDSSSLLVDIILKIDTLPVGFQRAGGVLPEDIFTDFTLKLKDKEVQEIMFVGNVSGVLQEDRKLQKEMRKVYTKFFRDAKMANE